MARARAVLEEVAVIDDNSHRTESAVLTWRFQTGAHDGMVSQAAGIWVLDSEQERRIPLELDGNEVACLVHHAIAT